MDGPQDILREIARLEREIEELLAYRNSTIDAAQDRALDRWSRFKSRLELLFLRRQTENHIRYMKLQLEAARDSYRKFDEAHRQEAG